MDKMKLTIPLKNMDIHRVSSYFHGDKMYFILIGLTCLPHLFFAQNNASYDNQIINLLDKTNASPISINFQNDLEVNNSGGHLQGVQYYNYGQSDYYILSGSSDSQSYFSVLKAAEKNRVISVNKILDKPFKHAGGFQIYKNLMAIGIEDNDAKDKSKVIIYTLGNIEKEIPEPLMIIERSGPLKRATAGCVAITQIEDYVLVAVGDWDTKNLDFYRIKKKELGKHRENFELVFSMETKNMDTSKWVDNSWLSYQNLNFIKDSSGNLYLAGMTSNSERNILDLFKVQTNEFKAFDLIKVYSKKLILDKRSNFRWGAGVYLSDDNQIQIISSGLHIQKEFGIYKYQ